MQLLQSNFLVVAILKLACNLGIPLVYSLLPVFEVRVSLLDVLERLINGVLHRSTLLFHFLVQLRVQQLDSRNTITLLMLALTSLIEIVLRRVVHERRLV